VINANGVGLLCFYNQMVNLSSTTPPNAPSGMSGSSYSPTEIDLQWNATANARYYIILRNGVQIGTTYDTVFYDRTATPGANYLYSLEAVGLVSTSAPSATITAPFGLTGLPPNRIAFDSTGDPAYYKPYPQWVSGDKRWLWIWPMDVDHNQRRRLFHG